MLGLKATESTLIIDRLKLVFYFSFLRKYFCLVLENVKLTPQNKQQLKTWLFSILIDFQKLG